MAERVMDTRTTAAHLRHRWPILLAGGVVGAGLGLLYVGVAPIELTSTSLVLLRAPSDQTQSDAMTDIDTQVRLAQSRPVLAEAGRAVQPALSASQVAKKVIVDGATSQLIEIHASSRRGAEAQALSQAVAEAYVNTLSDEVRSVTGETIRDLHSRETLLRQQVKALQDQISATNSRRRGEDPRSADARRDAQLLAQLTVDQTEAALKWDQVKKDLASSSVVGLADPAQIVQPASPATGPDKLSQRLMFGLAGAALFAVLAAVALLVRARRDPRLRTRDDLADAVGSTVLGDVRSRPQRSVAEWSALFGTYDAPPVDAWAFRQVLRSLAVSSDHATLGRTAAKRPSARAEHPRSVTVVVLAGDRRGLAVGPQLASFTASLGIVTRFVAAAGQTSAPSLWAACSGGRAAHLRAGLALEAHNDDHGAGGEVEPIPLRPQQTFDELLKGPLLSGSSEDENDGEVDPDAKGGSQTPEELDADEGRPVVQSEGENRQRLEPVPVPAPESSTEVAIPDPMVRVLPKHALADLTVVLAVADRRAPTLSGLPPTAVTVLAISSGSGNREELARLAVAASDAGRRIDGIVVADPDPADQTTGRRTLGERALETPLPVRMTGVSQLPLAGGDRGNGG